MLLAFLTLTAIVMPLSMLHVVHAGTQEDEAVAARHAYSEKVAAKYTKPFGETAFTPSNATTDTGEFIPASAFPTAAYCGHCHTEAHQQWRESAHSNANRAPWYLRNVELLKAEKGVAYTRHCEGCHDPVALLSGALTDGVKGRKPYDDDGVTCMTCHSIQKVDARGTGSYVMGVPAVMVNENGKPMTRPVSDAEILAHPDRHSKAVMKDFYPTSEFCAVCHKAALPRTLNDYKWQRAMSPYDEWQTSSFAKQSPLPFYKKDAVSTCETCHMQREKLVGYDPGAKSGTFASHRWLGANTLVPQFYKYPEQARRVRAYLQDNVFNVDIFAIEKKGGAVVAPLGTEPFALAAGEPVTVDVVLQNKGAAHSYVPEQRDMYESWVAFTVRDAATGKVLHQSGALQPNGELEADAHSFTNRLVNVQGTLNSRHEVWDNRVVAYNNTVQSGRSQVVRYSFHMPTAGSVTVTATVRYRRFMQHFIDFGMGGRYSEPIVDLVSAKRVFAVGENAVTPPAAGENALWMRWNNDGIALLDAQQYADAYAAFERVAALRPDYADAHTNMAIVDISWERYADARPNLEMALRLSPNNARALYYRALVERNEGKLDEAIVDLQSVLYQFPHSRDARRELGFSFYQQRRYPEAMEQYKLLQEIDPDDLAAHYNLSILYRRLGMTEQAKAEAAVFADQKDDPTASTYALEFLRKHPELANESVPWHTHELDQAGPQAESIRR